MKSGFQIRAATPEDVPLILELIRDLARYEKLEHKVVATEERLRETLFCARPFAEVLIGDDAEGERRNPVAFSLFFTNYSTFLGKPGIYLEDLYVRPEARGLGYGRAMLARLAKLAHERDFGRVEWAVLDWNEPAIGFYERLGARPLTDWRLFRLTGDDLMTLAAESGEESSDLPDRAKGDKATHGM